MGIKNELAPIFLSFLTIVLDKVYVQNEDEDLWSKVKQTARTIVGIAKRTAKRAINIHKIKLNKTIDEYASYRQPTVRLSQLTELDVQKWGSSRGSTRSRRGGGQRCNRYGVTYLNGSEYYRIDQPRSDYRRLKDRLKNGECRRIKFFACFNSLYYRYYTCTGSRANSGTGGGSSGCTRFGCKLRTPGGNRGSLIRIDHKDLSVGCDGRSGFL